MKGLVEQLQQLKSDYLASAGIEKVIFHIDGLIEAIMEVENKPVAMKGVFPVPNGVPGQGR